MAACRRITCFADKNKFFLFSNIKLSTASCLSKSSSGEIVVPHRIGRGPTDILKALASTISKDHTAAHYKYEDDPYFIPVSNITKRSFALSKESGKKAARYFLEKYPELFTCNTSVPHIKAFDPPVVYSEEDNLTVDILQECILNADVKNCIAVYDGLKTKSIAVSQAMKQDLLELLCFYNNFQPVEEDYYEERYFKSLEKDNFRWNPKGMAEKLFLEMEQDGKAYSAMICGASKFIDPGRATALYDEMRSKNLVGTVEAYNAVISLVPYLKESGESRWEYAYLILQNMESDGVSPDLCTMNAVLSVFSKTAKWKGARNKVLTVLSEMKRLNIEPSLGTYFSLLAVYNTGTPDTRALYSVIDELEGKELYIQHPTDVRFFSTAMELCWKTTHDKFLAYRIHKLVEFKNNCKLLGSAILEAMYFKSFFQVLCETEDLDKLMAIYEKYVPNTYTPEPSVIFNVIQAIHFNGLYKYLPRLCSDVLVFEQTERENIMTTLMEAAGCMKHETQTQTELVDMVWKILEKIKIRSQGKRVTFNLTGSILENVLKTFMYGNDFEKSWSIIEKLKNEENSIVGYPNKECLLNFCQMCFELKEFDKALFCAKYAINGSYPDFKKDLEKLTTEMLKSKKISEDDKHEVYQFLGSTMEDSSDSDSSGDSSSDESDKESVVPKV